MSMEYIIFDGVDSRNYGVYVHGDHAYDRPARRAERVTVQGRHGLLTTSEDCFEESVVTYPVAIVSGFKANIDAWLNELASRRGRHRLTDSFNAGEYRMASFLDAVEADPIGGSGAGRFEVTFQCLPQRFLLEGENVLTYPPGIEDSKNLLVYPYPSQSTTLNGLIFTVNSDGSITVRGTATANTNFALIPNISSSTFAVHGESYVISTGLSEAGGSGKWFINGQLYDGNKANGSYMHSLLGTDTIYQSEYTVDTSVKGDSGYFGGFYLRIANGCVCDNLTFRPMIRLASETDPEWVPYYDGATQIYNQTLFDALPLIRVYGAGTVGIGGMEVTVASSNYEYIDIDCDIMDCFNGTDNCNSLVSFSDLDFPVLKPGVNVVSLGENISRIEVKPRWWRT